MSRIGSVLTGDRTELRDGPQVHALLIQNQNPLTVCPDSNRVRHGPWQDSAIPSSDGLARAITRALW